MSREQAISLTTLREYKRSGRRFSVLTCYDAPTAGLMDEAGIDVLLVGDTAAEVVLGLPNTRDIRPEFLLDLTCAVRRGAPRSFVMADLPYGCRLEGEDATMTWVGRFYEEAGSNAVKIEVTGAEAGLVARAARAGIPVVAHLGLLPQSLEDHGGYRAQAKRADAARRLMDDARRFEEAGACMLLLEAVAQEVAGLITARSKVPVIGCASGPGCDGTVVVLQDMVGLGGGHPPRGVRRYEDLSSVLKRAFTAYADDVHAGRYPTANDAPRMIEGEFDRLMASAGGA